jgi:hypothetical protein
MLRSINMPEPEHSFRYRRISALSLLIRRPEANTGGPFPRLLADEAAELEGSAMHQSQLFKSRLKAMPARTMSMHHVCLVVSDIAATRDFYVNVPGFEEIHRPTFCVPRGILPER